ncbi:hypothetical protein CANMA_004237 [Candida margitis]|uniref:uncharacterized protein n=1 Tax=Candida margitis TaxID=1775924 RepID=UPI002226A512|nr:uncharacterized protein CANMA_004237 [Candida margitis]KAI5958393.1 hypothetical protein CANMA_004237 [Candida margitis]
MPQPIQELDPDFYISYNYPIDEKTKKVNSQTEKALYTFVHYLYDKGFGATIRPGDPTHLLIFIKLSPYKFIEEAEKDLIKNYEFGVTAKDDELSSRTRIIYQYLTNSKKLGGCGIVPGQEPYQEVVNIVPITSAFDESRIVEDLKDTFTRPELSANQIKRTYGVQIALYFEFYKYYIFWLLGLSILGVFQYFKQSGAYSLGYTFINLTWGTFFLAFWHRRQQYLVNLWGVQNSHLVEEHSLELAEINERFEPKSNYLHKNNTEGLRFVKQLFFIPIALGFAFVLISYQLGCFFIEIFLTDLYDGPGKAYLTLLPTVLLSVFVPILSIVYNLVTSVVIKLEGHDTQISENQSVLIKTYVLNFLTSYAPLLITSFLYLPFAHLVGPHLGDIQTTISSYVGENRFYSKYLTKLKSQKEFKINQGRLNAQFFYFIVTNQIVQALLKYVLPLVITKVIHLYQTKIQKKPVLQTKGDEPYEANWLQNVRTSLTLPEYVVDDDFRSVVLQYGYLILFGPVWPLAPLVSLIFAVVFFKLDHFKLFNGNYFKPPIPKRVDSIHPWNWALFLLTWLGSIVSPVVTAFYRHGTAPPKTMGQFALDNASVNISSSAKLVLLLIFSEHAFLFSSYVLYTLSNLFKSAVEWENDFVDNDIKLRHDHYSKHVKPTIKVTNVPAWNDFTVESTLDFTPPSAIEQENDVAAEKVPSKKQGYTTSTKPTETTVHSRSEQARVIAEKERLLRERQTELARLEKRRLEEPGAAALSSAEYDRLNRDKEPGDSIIEAKSGPNSDKHYSTIDNSTHAADNNRNPSNTRTGDDTTHANELLHGSSIIPPDPNDKSGTVYTKKNTTQSEQSARAEAHAPTGAGLATAAAAPASKEEKEKQRQEELDTTPVPAKKNKSGIKKSNAPATEQRKALAAGDDRFNGNADREVEKDKVSSQKGSNQNSKSSKSEGGEKQDGADDDESSSKYSENDSQKEPKRKRSGLKKLLKI